MKTCFGESQENVKSFTDKPTSPVSIVSPSVTSSPSKTAVASTGPSPTILLSLECLKNKSISIKGTIESIAEKKIHKKKTVEKTNTSI
jgi:hypothetical protein